MLEASDVDTALGGLATMWSVRVVLACGLILGVAGCTIPVTMVNPETNDVRTCGPYPGPLVYGRIETDNCVRDYKDQGYVRR